MQSPPPCETLFLCETNALCRCVDAAFRGGGTTVVVSPRANMSFFDLSPACSSSGACCFWLSGETTFSGESCAGATVLMLYQ